MLNSAVTKAGLTATLSGAGPFTVFAPTDSAFNASGITASVISNNLTAAQLNTILLYHTLPEAITAANVPAGPDAKVITASGDSVFVTNNSNGVFVNGIKVTVPNITASNGIIHEIGRVLIPSFGNNIVQLAEADTSLTYLVAAIVQASTGGTNVAGILSGSGPFTVFAPTNQAFINAGFPTIASIQAASPATLTSILTYHVIGARVFSSDLSNGEQAPTLNGQSVTIGLSGSGATVKGNSNSTASNITATNIVATNGVIHKIDQVLLPGPGTIASIVAAGSNFTILNSAITTAGLTSTLSSAGPFTVFAPTDSAFNASGITASSLSSFTSAQLNTILLYHTITDSITAANVPAGPDAKVITAGGDSVFVTNNSNGVFVNGIQVTVPNILASNGVIHEIGRVLIPSFGNNIVQLAEGDTSLSYLVAAIVQASTGGTNVAGILSGSGPFTVFAPTNQAFINAGFPTIASIQAASPATLTSILTYHVIGARVFSSDLTNGEQAPTLNGEDVTISLTGGATVKGNSNTTASNIIATNIVATNGVIHKIDQVLLP